jgi:hypothetical protein
LRRSARIIPVSRIRRDDETILIHRAESSQE